MRASLLAVVSAGALMLGAVQSDAMPLSPAPTSGSSSSSLIVRTAGACGPGLVRGRMGTCVVRRAVFGHGRIIRKGCGKPVGAGLRTPC